MSDDTTAIESHSSETRRFEPSPEFCERARVRSREEYLKLYRESLDSPETFWKRETQELVFRTPFDGLSEWKLPHAKWFLGATPNATESCLDRHLSGARRDKPAII